MCIFSFVSCRSFLTRPRDPLSSNYTLLSRSKSFLKTPLPYFHNHSFFFSNDSCFVTCRDVRKFKETKKQFDKVREDMEIAQVKNAQAPRNKPHEVEEASSTLIVTRKCFRQLALDYVLQVTNNPKKTQKSRSDIKNTACFVYRSDIVRKSFH